MSPGCTVCRALDTPRRRAHGALDETAGLFLQPGELFFTERRQLMLSVAVAVAVAHSPAAIQSAGTAIGCAPCSAADAAQDFTLGAAAQGLRHDAGSTSLCANASCAAKLPAGCWPLQLAPCSALTSSQRFLNYTGTGGIIVSGNGHALDYGVYCPGCPAQLGLGRPAAEPWEEWTVDGASKRVRGPGCCLTLRTPAPPPPPPAPPPPPSQFMRRWCPRFHASKGTDPSGVLAVNGKFFLFPDGSDDDPRIPPHHYASKDLLRWKRYPMGWGGDTGSITVTTAGTFRFWPKGGLAGPIARAALLGDDSTLSNWSAATTVVPIPKMRDGHIVANFRDPSRAVQLADGYWYMAVGSDTGDGAQRNTSNPADFAQDGTAALRLFRASDDSLTNWTSVGVPYVQLRTQGWVNYTLGEYNATGVAPPPFLECPDLFRAGEMVVLISSYNDFGQAASQGPPFSPPAGFADGQSAEWRTGALVPDGSRRAGEMDLKFVSKHQGVLDYGLLYAQKTAGDALKPNEGRRVLFGFTGWHERRNGMMNSECGISHVMPRDLRLDSDGRMLISPVQEVSNLKLGQEVPLQMGGVAVTTSSQVLVNMVCTGVPAPTQPKSTRGANAVGVDVLLDVAAGEWTRVGYDLQSGALFVDQSCTNSQRADLSDAYQTSASLSSVAGAVVDTLNLTVLVDGGMLESFVNERVVITSLLSPSTNGTDDADARQVRAFVHSTVESNALECRATASKLQSLPPQWLMKTDDGSLYGATFRQKTDDVVGHYLVLDEHSDWELVYDFETDACPDMNVRAHRRGDVPDAEPIAWFNPRTNKSSFVSATGGAATHAWVAPGMSLDNLKHDDCSRVVFNSSNSLTPESYANYQWLQSVRLLANGSAFGLVHNEFKAEFIGNRDYCSCQENATHKDGGNCTGVFGHTCELWSTGLAVSHGEPRLTAAIPIANPFCSCKLTRGAPGRWR